MRSDRSTLVGALVAAAAACVAPLAFVLVWCAVKGLSVAGPYSLFGGDQLRYLAWIRESGLHVLIADPQRAGAPHVYLQPLFLLSGLLWRAGLSIQLSYLVWTPVALVVLIWGYARFARHLVRGRGGAAALVLGLLYFSPLVPLLDYGGVVNANGANALVVAAGAGATYWQAWGYLPTIIALGLMPVCLLHIDSVLAGGAHPRRLVATAVLAALVAWLHPWGGIELSIILALLLLLRRGPAEPAALGVTLSACAAPLVAYAILARLDPAWSLSQLRSGATGSIWPLAFTIGPLLAAALLGPRPRTTGELVVTLWILAGAITYVALPGSSYAAVEGLSLPLAIMAVRGWSRLKPSPWLAYIAVGVLVLPGAAYSAHTLRDAFRSHDVPLGLTPGEGQAIAATEHAQGHVLTTPYLAAALPALAGLLDGQVVTGPSGLFDHGLASPVGQGVLSANRVSVVALDCRAARRDPTPVLKRLGFIPRSAGCARLYVREGVPRRARSGAG